MHSIPQFIQQRLGVNARTSYTSKENSIVVWFRWKGRTTRWFGNKTVIDQEGYKSEINGWNYNGNPPANAALSEIWLGYAIPTYPRRDASFKFQLSDWNEKVLGEFEIKNPEQINTEPYRADPFPIKKRIDEMEFSLLSLEVPDSKNMSKDTERIFQSREVRATFEISEKNQVVENWQPVNIWLEDATGNQCKNSSWSNHEEDGKASMTFSSGLFHGEAWKMKTQFARKSHFLKADLWTATIPLPQHPEYQTNVVSHVLHDKKIILRGIVDQNGFLLDGTKSSRNNSGRNKKQKQFHLFVEDMDTDLRLDLVEVVDDQGRKCKQSGKSWGGSNYDYGVEIEEDATSLTVTLAFHQSKFAEYIAMPQTINQTSEQ